MARWNQFNSTVTSSVAESALDAAFDSTFEKSIYPNENCTLRITLRIFFRRISPWQASGAAMRAAALLVGVPVRPGAAVGQYADADNKQSLIQDWYGADWPAFIQKSESQAKLWDGQFWLVPPSDFSLLDVVDIANNWKAGNARPTATRPNIKCEFRLEIATGPSRAHRIIDVVNLLGQGSFRSDNATYDSGDASVAQYSKPDWLGLEVDVQQPTIAHEIGHALGLPHIGNLRRLPKCELAVLMDKLRNERIPALYKGGINADACYGTGATSNDINNIMGAGSRFSEENANPWLDRLPLHFNLGLESGKMLSSLDKWEVKRDNTPPRIVTSRTP